MGNRLSEDTIDKVKAEEVLSDTMGQAVRQKKKTKRKFLIFILILILGAYPCLLFLRWGINAGLDVWSARMETPYHSADFSVAGTDLPDAEGYYVYRIQQGEFQWEYQVVAVDADGVQQTIFTIQEIGMDMDRAPKLIESEHVLYLLFEGIDNEDPIERLYGDKISADPQGFLPCLYKYDLDNHSIEKIELSHSGQIMLTDAFSLENKDCYIAQQFRGIIGDLHLGFYIGEKTIGSMENGVSFDNLFGDGGIKATGCVGTNGNYYVAGLDGIYEINLTEKTGSYVKAIDLSHCYRSELIEILLENDEKGYAVATAIADTFDSSLKGPKSMHTTITVYDHEWEELRKEEVPIGISAIEWGKRSAIVTNEDGNSYFLDFAEDKTEALEIVSKVPAGDRQLDRMDEAKEQWVYIESISQYLFTGDGTWYNEAKEP